MTGYVIELHRNNKMVYSDTILGSQPTTYTADNLLRGEEYEFRVAGMNEAGVGDFSPFLKTKTDPSCVDTSCVYVDVTSGQVRFTCKTIT